MRTHPFTIELAGPGRLATMPRPEGGAGLNSAMAALREAGVDVLVSALTPQECALADLTGEAAAAAAAGLDFVNIPIPDNSTPPRMEPVLELSGRLAGQVRSGRFVVTHCAAGIGRCSMLAGAVLVRLGLAPGEAWSRIRAARGLAVPDNASQELWLYDFAAAVAD